MLRSHTNHRSLKGLHGAGAGVIFRFSAAVGMADDAPPLSVGGPLNRLRRLARSGLIVLPGAIQVYDLRLESAYDLAKAEDAGEIRVELPLQTLLDTIQDFEDFNDLDVDAMKLEEAWKVGDVTWSRGFMRVPAPTVVQDIPIEALTVTMISNGFEESVDIRDVVGDFYPSKATIAAYESLDDPDWPEYEPKEF